MKTGTHRLLQELTTQVKSHIEYAISLEKQTEKPLNARITPDSWSILECIEHLNRYGNFYLPEIEKQINSSHSKPEAQFKSGLLGNYFAESMLPKTKLNKMKTFKNMNPIYSKLDKSVIQTFISQQKKLLTLLENAEKVSLNKTKTSISISTLIKLKLGDTFRFLIYHNERHIQQAQRVLKEVWF
ncbi:hypothetical protein ABH942_001317 [Flavobacterium sp. 28YEA47A]|uniref:DinB family protein n=1 Tax=Flavobacterium sp. 28YEA47A TaxID=3156276 RepID=UPI00351849A7